MGMPLHAGEQKPANPSAAAALVPVKQVRLVRTPKGVALQVEGIKPSPCHRIHIVRISKQDKPLRLRVVAEAAPGICAQVLTPFVARIALSQPIKKVAINGRWFFLSR